MTEKVVEAYFCSWCFPACDSEEKQHCSVKIKYTDGAWKEIFRMDLDEEYDDRESEMAMGRIVLEHFLKRDVSDEEVRRLVNMPGVGLCHIEPAVLVPFNQMSLFSTLGGGK